MDISIFDLYRADYQKTWELQTSLQTEVIAGSDREYIILCEHNPVLTFGGSADLSRVLLASRANLSRLQIPVVKTNRGGNITYHGPGQLICYPLLDLRIRRRDVSWYLRTLEDIVIDLLAAYGISASRIEGKTGVWTSENQKICTIGIRISRWCTMHGLAVNLMRECESGFRHIVPCGIENSGVSSIESILGDKTPSRAEISAKLCDLLIKRFYSDFRITYKINHLCPNQGFLAFPAVVTNNS